MKHIMNSFSIMLMVLAFVSCSNGKKNVFTPTSSGRPYEVLVVVNPGIWDRPAGRALYDVLDTDVPGLPQAERSFRISYTAPQNYDQILKLFRNIIIVNIDGIYTQPKFKYSKDVYASPQMILTIQAPDEASFKKFVDDNRQTIIDFFVKSEMNRQISLLKEKHNTDISSNVKSLFNCDIWLPTELTGAKKGDDFFWASTNTATADMNFVMYSYPYRDDNTFTKEYFIRKRDSVMKVNIPGAREGMYMATDTMYVKVTNMGVKGDYSMEARGLWHIKGDMMGGPFVSHSRIDKTTGRVVVAEVFIYSPDKLKRNLMRQMEASLYTLTLPDGQIKEEIGLDVPKE